MSLRETLVDFPGQLVRTIPTDENVREARDSAVAALGGYQGLSRNVLIAGAFLTVVLVVLINESLPSALGGSATVGAFMLAGAGQLVAGGLARLRGLEDVVIRNEELSLTLVLVVIALGALFAVTPFVGGGRYWLAGAGGVLIFTVGTAFISHVYVNKYLTDKEALLAYLQGFEHAPTQSLDELLAETETNPFLDAWLKQLRYRQEPMTLHEVASIKSQLL